MNDHQVTQLRDSLIDAVNLFGLALRHPDITEAGRLKITQARAETRRALIALATVEAHVRKAYALAESALSTTTTH